MHAVILSCVFTPEPVVSSRTSAELATALAAAGHTVEVITAFPSRPAGTLFPGFKRGFIRRDGASSALNITRCFSLLSRQSTVVSRLLENVSFGVTSATALLTARRPDVVYLNTWPLLATAFATVVARLRGTPIVLSVQDIYPESLASQQRPGAHSGGPLFRALQRLDGWIARSAAEVVVISAHFRDTYVQTRSVAPERVTVIPNWGDAGDVISNHEGKTAMREAWGIAPHRPIALYAGNIGAAAGVEAIIDAYAGHAEELPALVLAGAGPRLDACRAAAARESVPITIHTPWPAEETSAVLAAGDILLLLTAGAQALASVPSKVISYLLAGRPIVAQAPLKSETARILRAAGAGWVVEPGDIDGLRGTLRRAAALTTAERAAMGASGRAYAIENLSRERCLPKLVDRLERSGGARS